MRAHIHMWICTTLHVCVRALQWVCIVLYMCMYVHMWASMYVSVNTNWSFRLKLDEEKNLCSPNGKKAGNALKNYYYYFYQKNIFSHKKFGGGNFLDSIVGIEKHRVLIDIYLRVVVQLRFLIIECIDLCATYTIDTRSHDNSNFRLSRNNELWMLRNSAEAG